MKIVPLAVFGILLYCLTRLSLPVLGNPGDFFTSLFSRDSAFVLILTIGSSLIALFSSFVFAWILVLALRGRGGGGFRLLSVLPGMAYALVVLATLRTLGVQPRYSMASVIFAWILAGTPYLASVFSRARADLDPRNGEALRSLGASSFLRFWHHDFLGTRGAQVEALLQQFWLYLTSFSLVLILNGGPPNETLEVSIFTSMRLGEPRLGRALAYALIQSSLLVLLRIALNRLQGKEAEGPGVVEWGSGFRRSRSGLLVGIVIASVFVVRMGSDLESVDGFLKPLGFSVLVGVFASSGAVALSLSSYFSGMRWISNLGAWLSPVLLSLSIWQVFSGVFTPLSNVVLIQSLFLAPWFSRAVYPLLDRVRNGELEAARTLGADRFHAWMGVEWPRIRGGVVSTLGVIFALSLSEVSSVMLFSKGSFDTLSSFSQNLFTRFRLDEAAFGAVLLLLLSLGSIWVTEEGAA